MSAATGDLGGDNGRVHDAHMEDVGEKGRPPGKPQEPQSSWAQKVMGSNVGGRPIPEEMVDEAFVEARVRLEFPDGEDGEPVITIGA